MHQTRHNTENMGKKKKQSIIEEEDLLENFENGNTSYTEEDEDSSAEMDVTYSSSKKMKKNEKDLKDLIISHSYPPRPCYEQYSQTGFNFKLQLKKEQKIKAYSTASLVTTCMITSSINDYCLLIQPTDSINNLFMASKMFVFSGFTGQISIPVQNYQNTNIKLKAGTDIAEIHLIPFGVK